MSIDIIFTELEKVPDRKPTSAGSRLKIVCTNPDHSGGFERTPSCFINLDESSKYFGSTICYGCGEKGSWNLIAQRMGLHTIDGEFKPIGAKRTHFRENIKKKEMGKIGFQPPIFFWPENREWRGISGKVVLKFGGGLTEPRNDLEEPRLILSTMVFGEEVGRTYALIRDPLKDDKGRKLEESYLNSKGDWKEKALFGFDQARKRLKKFPDYPLWIEEGQRDVLKTYTAGAVVVGVLGSSFSDEKAELVKVLNPKRCLIASDNDAAGDKLAREIRSKLRKHFPLTRITWGEGKDPMDYPVSKLRKINQRFIA